MSKRAAIHHISTLLTMAGIMLAGCTPVSQQENVGANSNQAPTIAGTPPSSAQAGQAYSFQPTASDPDGDTLTFSIQNRPAWATFNASSGNLSGTPNSTSVGSFADIVISVSDGQGGNASLSPFSIEVTAAGNRAPTISGSPSTAATVGVAYSFTPQAQDPDGNTLTFSIQNKPAWATFTASTGHLYGTPSATDAGTYSGIIISVSDGAGGNAALPGFAINVRTATTGSATVSWQPPTQNDDGSALTNLAGYRILYGTSSGALNQSIQLTNPGLTSYVVDNLAQGTWFFAMKAYNSNGIESILTNVVSKTVN